MSLSPECLITWLVTIRMGYLKTRQSSCFVSSYIPAFRHELKKHDALISIMYLDFPASGIMTPGTRLFLRYFVLASENELRQGWKGLASHPSDLIAAI